MSKDVSEKKRAGRLGHGSVKKKLVNGRILTVLSMVLGFQEANKLVKYTHVIPKFNAKTKVLALEFVKAATPHTLSIDRSDPGGTAFIRLGATLKAHGVQLKESLIDEEYVFNARNGDMLVDLSGHLEKAITFEIKRDSGGKLAKLTRAERKRRTRQAERALA